MVTLSPRALDTPEYYTEVARRFEEVAAFVRDHPEIDPNVADHLKGLAGEILQDVGQERSRV
jgi:hypothetical protein